MFVVLLSGFLFLGNGLFGLHSLTGETIYEDKDLPGNLEKKIQEAREKGDYDCCLDPPCTMCYMGSWVFPQEECHCDEAIAEGNWDKVCPECKKGMKKGQCGSSSDTCDVDY